MGSSRLGFTILTSLDMGERSWTKYRSNILYSPKHIETMLFYTFYSKLQKKYYIFWSNALLGIRFWPQKKQFIKKLKFQKKKTNPINKFIIPNIVGNFTESDPKFKWKSISQIQENVK